MTYCEFSDTYDLECERPKKILPKKIFTFEKDFFYAAGKQEICQKWFDISQRHFVYLHTLENAYMYIVICRTHNVVKYDDVQNKNIAFIKDFFKL